MSEHGGLNSPEISDSLKEAQPVIDFFFPLEEEIESTETPTAIDEDDGFFGKRSQNTPLRKPTATESQPAVRSLENCQNSSAARQV